MAKVVVMVAMLFLQVQPLLGAVLCQRHHEMAAHSCTAPSEVRPDAMHHDMNGSAPADHDCDQMLACSLAPPASLPTDLHPQVRPSITSSVIIPWTSFAPAVVQARPFHPPRT